MAEQTPFGVEIESSAAWERRAKVSVSPEQWEHARSRVVEKLRRTVTMPGFRKGKVPLDVIRKEFEQRIDQQALEQIIPDAYRQVLESHSDIQPVAEPRVENLHLHENEGAHFDLAIEVRPQIELQDYKGLALERVVIPVTDRHIDKAIEELRDRHTQWAPVQRQAKTGDALLISFAPLKDDGTTNEAERTDNYAVELGSEGVLPEFNSALEGLQPEEDTQVDVVYPADYPREDLKGRSMRFHVQLKEVREKRVPTLDDDFAQSVSPHKTVAELRQGVREQLERAGKRESERLLREQMIDRILAANDVPVAPSLEARYLQAILKDLERGSKRPMDDAQREQLTERFRPSARRAVQRLVVLDQLRQAEGLDVTDGEIEAHIAKMAQEQHMEPQELRRAIAGSNNMERLRNDLAEEKVFGMLEQHANITVVERSVDEDVPADGPAAAPKQGGALSGSQQETQAAASAAGQSAEGPPPAAPGRKE